MNMLVVALALGPGGVSRYIEQFSQHMARLGNRVFILTVRSDQKEPVDLDENCLRYDVDFGEGMIEHLSHLPGMLKRVNRLAIEHDLDIIVANTPLSNALAQLIKKSIGLKKIKTLRIVHGMWAEEMLTRAETRGIYGHGTISKVLPYFSRHIENNELARSDYIIAVSDELRNYVEANTRRRDVHVIPAGVDTSVFALPDESKGALRHSLKLEDKTTVLFVGDMREVKGLEFLIDASLSLCEDYDIQFLIVGGGPNLDRMKEKVNNLELSDVFNFTGRVSNQLLIDCYRASDLFCLPSLWEGLPQTLLEAMSTGLPVVATSVGGIPSLIMDRENGLLIPPGDSKALEEGIRLLLDNNSLSLELGSNAREAIICSYSWETICKRIQNVIQ